MGLVGKLAKTFNTTAQFQKVRTSHAKDEALDYLFWIRILISLSFGFIMGFWGLSGFFIFVAYVTTMLGGSYMYYSRVLRISDADYMGQGVLSQEGVPTAIALFLVGFLLIFKLEWTLTYTYFHGNLIAF